MGVCINDFTARGQACPAADTLGVLAPWWAEGAGGDVIACRPACFISVSLSRVCRAVRKWPPPPVARWAEDASTVAEIGRALAAGRSVAIRDALSAVKFAGSQI